MAEQDTNGLSLLEGFQPFQGQDWRHQVLAFLGGILVWTATYVVVLAGVGGEPIATGDSIAAIHIRRNTAAIASAAVGVYFAALWTQACGGPLLNTLYLVGVEGLIPDKIYALGGTPPEHLVSDTGSFMGLYLTNPVWVRDHLIAGFPGIIIFFVIVTYWIQSRTPEEEREFAQNHLPRSWLHLRRNDRR